MRRQSPGGHIRTDRCNLGNTRLRYRSQKQQRSVKVMFGYGASSGMPDCLTGGMDERGP